MAPAEAPARRPHAAADGLRPRGRAFGLDVHGTYAVPALGDPPASAGARRVECRSATAGELDARWPSRESAAVVDLRHPDGRVFMSIRSHEELGYRIWAPHHGRHLVSRDGREIVSTRPRSAAPGWERLFLAQTLPLAAALQGLEVLHASAVGVHGRAVAFTASSGSGKSSLAAHLVAAGATFVTDDVLALEPDDGRVLAHPGPARAAVASEELAAVTSLGRGRLGDCVGSTDKLHVTPTPAAEPLPLALVYRVLRRAGAGAPRIVEHEPVAPRLVLGASFLPYLRTPERLLNQLATCAALASSVRVLDLEIPSSISARAAAAAVLAHVEGALGT